MAKTLDFNKVVKPTLRLIMPNEEKTVIEVSSPTERLVEELQEIAPQLSHAVESGSGAQTRDIYDLAARLISCNRSCLSVSAEDLRDKYCMNLESLIIFFNAYLDFINEITNAKN